jgi:transposase
MYCVILISGGLLITMGQHSRSEALFYYFRLEDQVPETHLLRLIERHISFAFVREKLKASYSDTGRPSIDPELLLRILLIGYLYGITSERKLVEELRMHLAWRWFTGLGFDQEIPHHSTFSKNRHGRFQESKLFEQLFEQIVKECLEVGLVRGGNLSVDGSFVEANAAKESRIPREQSWRQYSRILRTNSVQFTLPACNRLIIKLFIWCERGDSNPHGFTRQILSLVRLPIPPLSRCESCPCGAAIQIASVIVAKFCSDRLNRLLGFQMT